MIELRRIMRAIEKCKTSRRIHKMDMLLHSLHSDKKIDNHTYAYACGCIAGMTMWRNKVEYGMYGGVKC